MKSASVQRPEPRPPPSPPAATSGVLPDFCGVRAVFAVVVAAELLAMMLVLGSGRPLADFWRDLSLPSLYLQWIGLGGALALCLLGRSLKALPAHRQILLAGGVWLLVAGAASLVAGRLAPTLGFDLAPDGRFGLLLKTLAVASIVGALVLRYLYLQYLWRRQLEAESEARLQALQSRIRPHFLFNSMNTIAHLTRTRPALAEELVQDLADLFRVSLSDARRSNTLGQELELGRRYLHIEQQRLGERLQVDWDLEGLPLEARLPPLILQPLLENAVYHGVEPALEPGPIRICGRYGRHRVNISIRNFLPGEGAASHREGNRLALDNIRQRLECRFRGQASLVDSRVEDEYQVRMVFPHPWLEPGEDD